ncbi:MAG: hypothetical protein PHX21_11835 [bacterium]|nr:hypothetical protein [bacterium]
MAILEESYKVNEGEVRLTIIIGNAQIGISCVRLNDTILHTGDVSELLIGRGPEISGKTLSIKTSVNDVNPATNRTNVYYALKGGKTDKEYNLEEVASGAGAQVIYRAKFNLEA